MKMLNLIIVLAVWYLFAGVAAAVQNGVCPDCVAAFNGGGSPGVGTGASIDVETVKSQKIGDNNVYSVKFLCGEIPDSGNPAEGVPLAPGSYRTAININNPNPSGSVTFTATAVVADGNPGGAIATLPLPGQIAVEVDCVDITDALGNPTGFVSGFVVISVLKVKGVGKLNVIGVYTLKNVDVIGGEAG